MNHAEVDVLVLGGGPSGCAAAITAARGGLSVALLERGRDRAYHVGETLAPEAAHWIACLELKAALWSIPLRVSRGIVSLWQGDVPRETDYLCHPQGPALHLDRLKFDMALAASAEQRGVMVYQNCRPCSHGVHPCGWSVLAREGQVERSFTCRWIVDATGRAAWFVRRQTLAPLKTDHLVTLAARVEPTDPRDDRLAVEALPDGWAYYTPMPGGHAIAGVLTDTDSISRCGSTRKFWKAQISGSRLVATRIGLADAVTPHAVNSATQFSRCTSGAGWVAVGDAAASCDPLSGSGICFALASGYEGGQTILASENGERGAVAQYQRYSDSMVRRRFIEQVQNYALVNKWPDRSFWRRRSSRFAGNSTRRGTAGR